MLFTTHGFDYIPTAHVDTAISDQTIWLDLAPSMRLQMSRAEARAAAIALTAALVTLEAQDAAAEDQAPVIVSHPLWTTEVQDA